MAARDAWDDAEPAAYARPAAQLHIAPRPTSNVRSPPAQSPTLLIKSATPLKPVCSALAPSPPLFADPTVRPAAFALLDRPRSSTAQLTTQAANGATGAEDADDTSALREHMSRLMTARAQGTATSSTATGSSSSATANSGGGNKVKILRRDAAGGAETRAGVPNARREEKSAEQRQAEYEKARAAIFGQDDDGAEEGGSGSGSGNSNRADRAGRGGGGDKRVQQRLSNSNSADNLSRTRPSRSPPPVTLPEEQREEEPAMQQQQQQQPTRSGRSAGGASSSNASSHPIIAELLNKQERDTGGGGGGNRRRKNAGKGGKPDADEFSRNHSAAPYTPSYTPSYPQPSYQSAPSGYDAYHRPSAAPTSIPASYYDQQADPYRAYGAQYAPYRQSMQHNGGTEEGGGGEWDEEEAYGGGGGGGAAGRTNGGRGEAYVPEVWDEEEFPSLSGGPKR